MASVNALSVALFNAAAGGYSADIQANPAAYAVVVGAVLEKDLSSNAAFVEHLLVNFGIATDNAVYAEAQTALTAMVAGTGRANATVSAIDFLAAVPRDSAFAAVANAFFAKVDAAAAFSRANTTELDVSKLISGVTGVDTDVVAANAAFAAGAASRDSEVNGLQVSVAGLRDELAAAQAATAAATAAAATAATAAAATLKAAQDAAAALKLETDAAAKTAADALAAANATIRLIDDTEFASESAAAAAAKAAAEAVAKTAADAAAKDAADALTAANATITALQNPAGGNFVLTAGPNPDVFIGIAGANDTFTATSLTLAAGQGDILVDGSSSDNDTLNITGAAFAVAIDTTGNTIRGIENVNATFDSLTQSTFTAAGMGASNITISQARAGSGADMVAAAIAGGSTVNAGNGVNSMAVTAVLNGNLTVNGGAATTAITGTTSGTGNVTVNANNAATVTAVAATGTATVNTTGALAVAATGATINITAPAATTIGLTGTAATTDVATVAAGGTVTVDNNAANAAINRVETLNISGASAAVTATLTGAAATTINMTGSQNVTLVADDALLNNVIINNTSTGTTTVTVGDGAGAGTIALGETNLSRIAANNIRIDDVAAAGGTGLTLNVAPNANLTLVRDLGDALILDLNDNTTANVTGTVSLGLGANITSQISIDATATSDNITTLNVTPTIAQTALDLQAGALATVNQSGAVAVALAATSTALAYNAAAATGAVTATTAEAFRTLTTGSGADQITLHGNTLALTVNTGDGNDTVNLTGTLNNLATIAAGNGTDTLSLGGAANISAANVSGFEIIALDTHTLTASGAQLSGQSFVLSGTGNVTPVNIGATLDLAGLVFSGAATTTVNFVTGKAATLGAGSSTDITGTAVADTITLDGGADSVRAGAGNDVIFGGGGNDTLFGEGGNDTIEGNAGNDFIDGGAGDDNLFGDNSGTNEIQTITMTHVADGADLTVTALGVVTTFASGATSDTMATNAAAAINANTTINKLVTASAATNVLTLTYVIDGNVGEATFFGGAVGPNTAVIATPTAGTNEPSGGVDTITGGEGADFIVGGQGNDIIILTEAVASRDTIFYRSGLDGRDTITGFAAGGAATSDVYATTFVPTTAAFVTGAAVPSAGALTLATNGAGAAAVFEVSSTSTLRAPITDFTSGAQVLAALSDTSVSVTTDGDNALLVIYSGGNAFLYEINEPTAGDGDALVAAADITLVGIFNGIADGAFVAADFLSIPDTFGVV